MSESLPTEWDRLTQHEKDQRVRETPSVAESESQSDADEREVVDPGQLDWTRIWDHYDVGPGYRPQSSTQLTLMIEAHGEVVMPGGAKQAIEIAVDEGALVERGARYIPGSLEGVNNGE